MADPVAVGGHGPTLRIDKYLWFARLSKSRSTAQKLAEDGHIRVNGRRIEAVRPSLEDVFVACTGQHSAAPKSVTSPAAEQGERHV